MLHIPCIYIYISNWTNHNLYIYNSRHENPENQSTGANLISPIVRVIRAPKLCLRFSGYYPDGCDNPLAKFWVFHPRGHPLILISHSGPKTYQIVHIIKSMHISTHCNAFYQIYAFFRPKSMPSHSHHENHHAYAFYKKSYLSCTSL